MKSHRLTKCLLSRLRVAVCLCSGLHEILKMTVAIPLLYGIPPEHEYLRYSQKPSCLWVSIGRGKYFQPSASAR